MANPISDDELIDNILEGDRDAINNLIVRYQDFAFNLSLKILRNREDAEETTQDSFVKAIKAIRAFQKHSSFKTWLYRIVYNTSLNKLRQSKKEKVVYFNELSDDHFDYASNSEQYNYDEKVKKERIKRAFETLNPENRVIMSLFYQENMSIDEIATITLLNANLVKVRMHRSREQLKPLLKDLLTD